MEAALEAVVMAMSITLSMTATMAASMAAAMVSYALGRGFCGCTWPTSILSARGSSRGDGSAALVAAVEPVRRGA